MNHQKIRPIGPATFRAVTNVTVVLTSQRLRHGYLSAVANVAYGPEYEREFTVPAGSLFKADPKAGSYETVGAYIKAGDAHVVTRKGFWESLSPEQKRDQISRFPQISGDIVEDLDYYNPSIILR